MVRIFRHYVPLPLFILALAEFSILFAAMYLGVNLRFAGDEGDVGTVGAIWPRALIFTAVMLSIMTALGLYQRELRESDWGYYSRYALSFGLGFVAMTLVFYALPSILLGRGAFGLVLLIAFVGTVAARLAFLRWVDYDKIKRQVLVLGTGTRAAKIAALEKAGGGRHRFNIVGYLPLQAAHHFVDRTKILSDRGRLLDIARKYNIEEIVVGVRDRRNGGLPMQEILECKLAGIRVIDLSSFFERETGHVQLDSLNTSWIVFSDGFLQTSLKDVTKRLFDIVVSGLLLLLAAPLMLLTMLAIKLDSRGPLLYKQARVGQDGKVFDVLKFRSMTVNAEKDGVPQWAQKNDARVTRVGKIIRTLRIDELPQIFNVFRGDMSFVGPRPERPFFVDDLSKKIAYYNCRHCVKPGITGWAQVRYPYGSSIEDAVQKLQYDFYYVKNHSLFLDLIILFQTAQVVLFGKGAR